MKKPVNDIVNKTWAASVKQLLLGCSPDVTSLHTKLLTITRLEAETVKTQAAKRRFNDATAIIMEGVKYGWAYGLSGKELVSFTKPKGPFKRRINALMPIAIEAGRQIGCSQLERINKAHGIPKPGQFSHIHAR